MSSIFGRNLSGIRKKPCEIESQALVLPIRAKYRCRRCIGTYPVPISSSSPLQDLLLLPSTAKQYSGNTSPSSTHPNVCWRAAQGLWCWRHPVITLLAHCWHMVVTVKCLRTRSFRQKAQIVFGFAAFTGVPLGLTGTRVPAASAFLCSRWMRSFLEMGMVAVCLLLRWWGVSGIDRDQRSGSVVYGSVEPFLCPQGYCRF
jgi:hypothetical protein